MIFCCSKHLPLAVFTLSSSPLQWSYVRATRGYGAHCLVSIEAMHCRGCTSLWSHLSRAARAGTSPAICLLLRIRAPRREYRTRKKARGPAPKHRVQAIAGQWSIYDDPPLYERVFADRDYEQEVKFLFQAFKMHAQVSGRRSSLEVLLELGCGPARHCIEAARQGARRAIGVDNNSAMVRHAEKLAGDAGVQIELLQGSIGSVAKDFRLGASAHLAFFPFGTIAHALDGDDALAWLQDVSACLAPGGLIVLQMEHPGGIFDGALFEGEQWEIDEEEGAERLLVTYGVDTDDVNPVTQVHTRTVEVSRRKKADWEVLGSCKVAQRVYTVPEIELMARLLHLDVVHFHGSLNMEVDNLFHEDAHEMVVIMRKPLST